MQEYIQSFKVHNWRRFENLEIKIPQYSSVIVDTNGSGKTSILSAVYSLFTGKPWPNTKFNQALSFDQQYFGLSVDTDWSLSGQFSPSGRLLSRFLKPETSQVWPKVLTYTPADNSWFSQSRTNKLATLDELICSVVTPHYSKTLSSLDTAVKAKQRLIKYTFDSGQPADSAMVQSLSQEIYKLSKSVWATRFEFILFWQKSLPDFTNWIKSPLQNWQIYWHRSLYTGQKVAYVGESLSKDLDSDLLNFDWNILWKKELASCKVLFGAQRDDFSIESNHLAVENVLSRGEMRLLVLFTKDLVVKFSKLAEQTEVPVFYLYDDVFNELDGSREVKLFSEILEKQTWFLASSTRSSSINCPIVSISDLLVK